MSPLKELERLAEHLSARDAAFMWCGAVLGLRWSEAAGLTVGSIDMLRGNVRVTAQLDRQGRLAPPKTRGWVRSLAAPPWLLEALAGLLRERALTGADSDALVFVVDSGAPLSYTNWRARTWVPATTVAGLPGLHFHDLRSVAASALVASGVDLCTAMHRLGHTTPAMTLPSTPGSPPTGTGPHPTPCPSGWRRGGEVLAAPPGPGAAESAGSSARTSWPLGEVLVMIIGGGTSVAAQQGATAGRVGLVGLVGLILLAAGGVGACGSTKHPVAVPATPTTFPTTAAPITAPSPSIPPEQVAADPSLPQGWKRFTFGVLSVGAPATWTVRQTNVSSCGTLPADTVTEAVLSQILQSCPPTPIRPPMDAVTIECLIGQAEAVFPPPSTPPGSDGLVHESDGIYRQVGAMLGIVTASNTALDSQILSTVKPTSGSC